MPAPTSDFDMSTHKGLVVITRRKGKFRVEMTPNETEKATYIIGLALSMVGMSNVPDHIINTPFVVRFFPKRILALERLDRIGSMPFRINEGDDLIKMIQICKDVCLNERAHGKAVPSGPATVNCMVSDEPL